MDQNPERRMPMTTRLSAEEKAEFLRTLTESQREYLGDERFEVYGTARYPRPAWMASISKLPERDENGLLPTYIPERTKGAN
jgi:hypothetical protein